MSDYIIFAKRVSLVAIVQILLNGKGLITLPILTKFLGTYDFGIWIQILATVSLLQPFVHLGLGSAIVRFLPAKEKEKIVEGLFTVIFVAFLSGLALCLILILIYKSVPMSLLKDFSPNIFIIVLPIIILESLTSLAINSFRILGQIKRYSIVILLENLIEIVLIFLLVSSGYGLIGALFSVLISRTITFCIILILLIKYAGFAFPNFSLISPFLSYSLPFIPFAFFSIIIDTSDRYIIGFYLGPTPVGIYSAASSIGGIVAIFLAFISYVLGPTVSKSFDNSKIEEVKNYLAYSWKYILMLSIPSAFGLSVLGKPLLNALTTPEFVTAGQIIIPFTALSMILNSANGIFGQVIQLYKVTRIFPIAFAAAAVVNLVLNLILVPLFGIVGAAIATLSAYVVVSIIIFIISRRYMKFFMNITFIVKTTLASSVMALIILKMNPTGTFDVILSILIGAVVCFAVLIGLKGFGENEKLSLIHFIRRLRH